MKKAATTRQMKRLDRLAQERYGIPSIVLMENAGRASADEIAGRFKKGAAAVVCGLGNNGGDGFVCARYLTRPGIRADIFLLGRHSALRKGDALTNYTIAARMGIRIYEVRTRGDLRKYTKRFRTHYDLFVDALFGIGFRGVLPGLFGELVTLLNATDKPIYALDVPSGLDATTGTARGPCVRAYKTITFGCVKKGFRADEAGRYVGKLAVKEIGFPRALLSGFQTKL